VMPVTQPQRLLCDVRGASILDRHDRILVGQGHRDKASLSLLVLLLPVGIVLILILLSGPGLDPLTWGSEGSEGSEGSDNMLWPGGGGGRPQKEGLDGRGWYQARVAATGMFGGATDHVGHFC